MKTLAELLPVRSKVTPDTCKSCRHVYYDALEGYNCTKYDATITFSDGDTMPWHGQAIGDAIKQCKGKGYSYTPFTTRNALRGIGTLVAVWVVLAVLILAGVVD